MLKAGFIGFGRMGITHFSILNTHPSVKIAAVCDQSGTMLNLLKKYVGVEVFSDYRKMIAEIPLDFVVISTPPDSHSEIIQFAIDNNIHTFTEKPFALTGADGKKTLAHLEKKPLVNQVGYVNRFHDVFMEVKKLLNAGVIGEIKNFSSEMYGAIVLKDSKASWRGKRKMGGGCMYEFASHCIDLIVYFFGQPHKVVGSILQSIYSSNVEDLVSSTFIYNNGISGTVMVNWSDESYRKPTFIINIFGTKGKIAAYKQSYKIFLKSDDQINGFHKGWNTRYITDIARGVRFYVRGNEFTMQLDYFVDCIEQGQSKNVSSFSEALKTDIVMEEIIKDAASSVTTEDGGAARLADFAEELKTIIHMEKNLGVFKIMGNEPMLDRVIFGDNQFFGINHMSEEKAQALAERFRDLKAITDVIDIAYDCGIRAFMLNTHGIAKDICDHWRQNSTRFADLRLYPSMPYAHKYASAVAEKGIFGALKDIIMADSSVGEIAGMLTKGGASLFSKDMIKVMQLLVDIEMKAFRDLNVRVIFLQNIVTDLLLGFGVKDVFVAFASYIKEKYGAEPGFVTVNLPHLVNFLLECGIENPIVCSTINKTGYAMNPDKESYEKTIAEKEFHPMAMSILASGAIKPKEAVEYVCRMPNIRSIVFGASSKQHIIETKQLIENYS